MGRARLSRARFHSRLLAHHHEPCDHDRPDRYRQNHARHGHRHGERCRAWLPALARRSQGPRSVYRREMSRRLLKERLAAEVARLGFMPDTFFALSHEDVDNMQPLNTPAGQQYIDGVIRDLGGVDAIIFDNVMALIAGDQKDEEGWRQTLPWVKSLTQRNIGHL